MDEYIALKLENEKLNKDVAELLDELNLLKEEGLDMESMNYNKKFSETFSGIQALNYINNNW